MTGTYYKATRPDGTSFYDRATKWTVGEVTTLPRDSVLSYLSASASPTDCTGMGWPCRLFRVEPVKGHTVFSPNPRFLQNKRGATAWRVVEELDPKLALGPNADAVLAIIDRASRLTSDEAGAIHASRRTARGAVWDAARDAAGVAAGVAAGDAARGAARGAVREAAWGTAWGAIGGAAGDAAFATVVRDLITPQQYETLMTSWWAGVGREEN